MSADNLLVADDCELCGKRRKLGSGKLFRQAAPSSPKPSPKEPGLPVENQAPPELG